MTDKHNKKYVVALDQGTTSSRAIVFDRDANVVSQAQREFAQFYPQAGWVEHDPMEIWATQSSTLVEALAQASIEHDQVAAIGITNQRETTVVWDRHSGRPIHNAIVWQCRRSAAICAQLKRDGLEDYIRETTGLVTDPYFSGTKLKWILDNVEGARERARNGDLLFGTIDTWLIWKLTEGKVHVTDYTNASRTMLFNIHSLDWDARMLEVLDIPRSMLPEVRNSSEVYGNARIGGVGGGELPIAGIAGDQQAALFGQACYSPGASKCTYGTGSFVLANTGPAIVRSEAGLLSTVAWMDDSGAITYALEGSVFVTGAAIQWLRDGLGILGTASDSETLARSVPDSGGVVFVPALTGLGAPDWDPHARGTIFGLTRGTTAAHLARATLEAIAFEVRDVIEVMTAEIATVGPADAGPADARALRVDGGGTGNDLLMQIQADQLQIPVERPMVAETTGLGAAFLAGLATGVWSSPAELASTWRLDRRFAPGTADDAAHRRWREAVRRSLGWADR